MDPKLQTSFIPQRNTGVRRRSVPMGFFTVFGYCVFFGSILIALGLYAANYFIGVQIENSKNELSAKVVDFKAESRAIDDIIRFDTRLKTAKRLLDSHVAMSKIFEIIERNTIQSVQFTDFNYTNDGSAITVGLSGKAPNFESLAFQSDTLSKESALKNQVFSGVTLTQDGTISFKFTAVVDSTTLPYTVGSLRDTTASSTVGAPEQTVTQ